MVNVGIIGFGTVGSGTAKILLRNRNIIRERAGFSIALRRIADLDVTRDRGIKLPKGILTRNADEILGDPKIDIVVELIGGIGVSRKIILEAIRNGKHVVTANKALLATHGAEIFEEAQKKSVEVGFEASVAGGIPIIKVLREGLVSNRIKTIFGIINGTTNYILTKMSNESVEFADALAEAKRLGYAEADPTHDIEGHDSAHKLAILSSIAFGNQYTFDDVYCQGISWISPMDIDFARELGYKLKLLAITKDMGDRVDMRVHPTLVPEESMIAKVEGVYNAIYIEGDAVGSTLFYGRGAGDMPTGSAVVGDIVDIARGVALSGKAQIPLKYISKKNKKVLNIDDVHATYYFRFSALDKPGVLSKISGILGKHNISIASVIQKDRRHGKAVPLVVLTHVAREKDVRAALNAIDKLPTVAGKSIFIRVETQ